ncbi:MULTISPECIES: hypothetical protein [unclassified Rhizobium]|uniref:phage tail assembly chaperone n=1 Tax=unclassified Rhizobium TaxID=2613769 RepID=UPI00160EFD40|nr:MULTISPECIES: hypothetical protein [unclassified Rhizobium]MBB3289912.1 hypothetical protein [Rhizobium sp. BK252]MBB3404141.1 hypothetical protein [Rhizobium sp. BK289]MBB3417240.1 hypothetical protein [Rhizobium sp. BK284]MBB3485117.1 hypothetical protein [Rhizobium sp. BK347]
MKKTDRLKHHMVTALKESLVTRKRPRVPSGGALLWRWFLDLSRSRCYHMNGPNPITHAEIEAYCRLYRIAMQPHHIAILRAMDDAYIDQLAVMRNQRDGVKVLPHTATGKISAGLFDTLFG